jgi:hypothetical protein
MPPLQVMLAARRSARQGDEIATWFSPLADRHGEFSVEVIALAQITPQHERSSSAMFTELARWTTAFETMRA